MSGYNLQKNYLAVTDNIALLSQRYQRLENSVQLLAVSKNQPIDKIKNLYDLGQRDFGENYLQEAVPKIIALNMHPINWHFIGSIQRNKTALISEHFSWVHTISSLMIADRLNHQRPAHLPALNVCLQINVSNDLNKAGIACDAVQELAIAVSRLPRLKLRGLMTLPTQTFTLTEQRATFHLMKILLEKLAASGLDVDTLSMGMSQDYEAAIAEGATLIRIGTALFGQR